MKFILLSLLVSYQPSLAVNFVCTEKFPKPLEDGCQFERCAVRIKPHLKNETTLWSLPSMDAKKVITLTKKDVLPKISEYKSRWVKAGSLKALSQYASEDGKTHWSKGDVIPYVEYESEGLGFHACIGSERIDFPSEIESEKDCAEGVPCLKQIESPKYVVWGKVKINGKVGWINVDDLDVTD